jgi:hypothetical protein
MPARNGRTRFAACALAALAPPLPASTIEHAEFRYADHAYHYRFTARLEARADAVRRVMTNFDALARINDDIIVSRVLATYDAQHVKRQLLMKHCLLVFCFDLDFVEQIEFRDDGDIVTTIVPGEGNFRRGETVWRIEGIEGGGTRVTSSSMQEPAFFIPPVIGPLLMKRSFLREIAETTRRLEILAREEPAP